jgi:hypothetical protein
MKTGRTLEALALELDRQRNAAEDMIVPTAEMKMTEEGTLAIGGEAYPATQHCHSQIAERMGIPGKYYSRMRETAPDLLCKNVNHWFEDGPKSQLIRTMDGEARAFLSDRYARIDNFQIAEAAVKGFAEAGTDIELLSCEVTDQRLYINARFPELEGAVAPGDFVQGGLSISNSEIGMGSAQILPLAYRLICTNGMTAGYHMGADGSFRRTHLGSKIAQSDNYAIYADDTAEAIDKAVALQMRDTIHALADGSFFEGFLETMREAVHTSEIERPTAAIKILGKRLGFTEREGEGILGNFLRGEGLASDNSKWGLANAVTKLANNVESFDRAQELMRLGSKVLDLPNSQWQEIAKAEGEKLAA